MIKAFTILSMGVVLGVVMNVTAAVEWEFASVRARRYYDLTTSGDIDEMTLEILKTVLELDPDVVLKQYDSLVTAQGTTLVRLAEEYNGNKVQDSQMDVSLKANGRIDRLGGRVTRGMSHTKLQDQSRCKLEASNLLNIALSHEGLSLQNVTIQRMRMAPRYVIRPDGEPAYLYFYDLFFTTKASGNVTRTIFRIDPCIGSVVDVTERLASMQQDYHPGRSQPNPPPHAPGRPQRGKNSNQGNKKRSMCSPLVNGVGGNEKTGRVLYGFEPNCLSVTIDSEGNCFLENEYIKVIDLKNGTEENITAAVKFNCSAGYDDQINGGFSPATDAFYHATQWAQMFRDWYSYAPLTNPSPRAYVHFGGVIDNAFWDGRNILLGNGGRRSFPYTTLDIVAHELAHGITERASDLDIRSQSGAIAESFADSVGEVAEAYVLGDNDWMLGANVMKRPGKAIRYLFEPILDGRSISHFAAYKKGMDIHHASGLFNKAFYYVAEVLGLGVRRSLEAFLVANRIYWHENTGFEEAACDVIKGAYDSGLDMKLFARAFRGIGLMLHKCDDLSEFVLPITKSERRDNLRVSRVTQPIFKVIFPELATGFKVTVSSNVDTKISISSSPFRSSVHEKKSGINQVFFISHFYEPVYIRLLSRESEDQTASIVVDFE